MPVSIHDAEWIDAARARTIPIRVYLPAGEAPAPVVVVSHATGGSREGYAYLGRAWAERGYVSLHLQHRGSDVDCWRGKAGGAVPAMRRAVADPQNAADRVDDLRFALSRLVAAAAGADPFAGRIDPARIGAAGHSFGAATVLATAGQRFLGPAGDERCHADPRVAAVLAMSSPRAVTAHPEDPARPFAAVAVPCLHLTGTRDDSPLNDTRAAERRLPFDHIRGRDQVLVTFAEGEHMVFAGERRLFGDGAHDARIHAAVVRASLAFWNAYLGGDAAAQRWLLDGGLADLLGAAAVVETRRV
jgi:predicted dienelactone hydrolase